MKRLFLSVALLVLGAGCASNHSTPANSDKNSSNAPTTQPAAAAMPVNKYCAVDRDSKIDPKVTYLYQGKVIGFCCEDCIEKFKKDPDNYVKNMK